MEQRERFMLEIIAAIVFIAVLILISLIVMNSDSETKTTITNSYNTYNINTYPSNAVTTLSTDLKPYIVDSGYSYNKAYYVTDGKSYVNYYNSYLRYSDNARLVITKSILGTDINNYEVHVLNREYMGGYFKVVYYFTDYYGRTKSYPVTKYIPAREEKKFVFKDISPSDYKYKKWYYEIFSLDKTPSRVYYNN